MRKNKVTPRKAADNIFTYAALIVMSVIFLFPCLWLILASLSKTGSLYDFKGFFPAEFSFQTFIDLFTDDVNGLYPYKTWFFNTLYVAVFSSLLGTVLVLLTAYVMSRFRFKGRDTIKKTTLVLGMFPGFMSMSAVYFLLKILLPSSYQSHASLIIVYSAGAALSYYIAKGFFDTVPKSLDEAARMDGASRAAIFRQILPGQLAAAIVISSTPALAVWLPFLLPAGMAAGLFTGLCAQLVLNRGEKIWKTFLR